MEIVYHEIEFIFNSYLRNLCILSVSVFDAMALCLCLSVTSQSSVETAEHIELVFGM